MIVILVVSTPVGNSNGRKMNENRARVLTQLNNGQTLGKREHYRDKQMAISLCQLFYLCEWRHHGDCKRRRHRVKTDVNFHLPSVLFAFPNKRRST